MTAHQQQWHDFVLLGWSTNPATALAGPSFLHTTALIAIISHCSYHEPLDFFFNKKNLVRGPPPWFSATVHLWFFAWMPLGGCVGACMRLRLCRPQHKLTRQRCEALLQDHGLCFDTHCIVRRVMPPDVHEVPESVRQSPAAEQETFSLDPHQHTK